VRTWFWGLARRVEAPSPLTAQAPACSVPTTFSIAVLGTSAVTLTNGGPFQAANLYLGNNTGAQTGTLNVRSASQATLTNLLIAGNHANGIVNVDGPTSLLTSKGGYIGYGGIGTVNLTNGGSLQLRRR
jgi:T5SS/PEP-CTERM-associated repeat protein